MSIRAAIDIGSNSVKLLVLRIEAGGAYTVLGEQSRVTGLSSGLAASGRLSPEGVAASIDVIGEYVARARELGAESIVAAGTAALRETTAPKDLTAPLRERYGLAVRILSGDEEAQLSRAVALHELQLLRPGTEARDLVFFDTGGGSTELSHFRGGALQAECSLPLGARVLTDRAGVTQPVTDTQREKLTELIEAELSAHAPHLANQTEPDPDADAGGATGAHNSPSADKPTGSPAQQPGILAGLGGTASTLALVLRARSGQLEASAHGVTVTRGALEALLDEIAALPLAQVEKLPRLDPARAPVVFAGGCILAGLMRFYGAQDFLVVDRGLRYGLLLARTA